MNVASTRKDYLNNWFPTFSNIKRTSAFFHAYNEHLCCTPAARRVILDDKLILTGVLESAGVRTPRNVLIISRGRIISKNNPDCSIQTASRELDGMAAFIKPRTGLGGKGAFRLNADGGISQADGTAYNGTISDLLSEIKGSSYLIQELIPQAASYAEAAHKSLNTIRCVTYRKKNGTIRIAGATWRVGNGASVVDNASGGGMFCGIHPVNKKIIGPARNFNGEVFPQHPHTGFAFEGTELPGLSEVFDLARSAHRAVNSNMILGWDIAMTPSGPCVIEGNGQWMSEVHVPVDRGFKDRLWRLFLEDNEISGTGFTPANTAVKGQDIIKTEVLVSGHVQGVGYRKWVSRFASDRGVSASAVNNDDGTVSCSWSACAAASSF